MLAVMVVMGHVENQEVRDRLDTATSKISRRFWLLTCDSRGVVHVYIGLLQYLKHHRSTQKVT